MARRKKPAAIPEGPQERQPEVLALRPIIDVREDTPQYYANHIEINFTVHDFSLLIGRISSRIKPEDVAEARKSHIVKVPADVQILLPTTLIAGLLRALLVQKDAYEKQYGVQLIELTGGSVQDE